MRSCAPSPPSSRPEPPGAPPSARTPPAGSISATISERFEANSNYNLDDPSPGTSYFADTRLSLGFLNETDDPDLRPRPLTGLRALWEAEQDFEFTLASPTGANLDYANEWANAAFDAAFDYRQRLVNYNYFEEIVTDGDLLPDDLDQLQGDTREHALRRQCRAALGTDAPSSYELRFLGNKIDYSEVGTNRTPRTTLEGQGAWQLQLTPVLASAVFADYLYYNADNAEDTALRRSRARRRRHLRAERVPRARGRHRLCRPQARGHHSAGVRETTQDDSGPSLRGDFSYTARTSSSPATRCSPRRRRRPGSTRWCGDLRAAPRPAERADLPELHRHQQRRRGGAHDRRQRRRGARHQHRLERRPRLRLRDPGRRRRAARRTEEPDIDRTTVTASYSYALTEVVDLDIGYRYRSRDEEPDSAQSHAVFFQIGRTFETSP